MLVRVAREQDKQIKQLVQSKTVWPAKKKLKKLRWLYMSMWRICKIQKYIPFIPNSQSWKWCLYSAMIGSHYVIHLPISENCTSIVTVPTGKWNSQILTHKNGTLVHNAMLLYERRRICTRCIRRQWFLNLPARIYNMATTLWLPSCFRWCLVKVPNLSDGFVVMESDMSLSKRFNILFLPEW